MITFIFYYQETDKGMHLIGLFKTVTIFLIKVKSINNCNKYKSTWYGLLKCF